MSNLIDLAAHRAKMVKGQELYQLALDYRELLSSMEALAGLALSATLPEDRPGHFDAAKAARLKRLLAHLKPCVLELADITGLNGPAQGSGTGAAHPPLGA